jgi:lysophospholipase L1-like esterase
LTGANSEDEVRRVSDEFARDQEKPHSILSTSYLYNFVMNSIVLIDVKFRSRTGNADWIKSIEDREVYLRGRMKTYQIDDKKLNLLRRLLGELKQTSNQIGADLLIVAIPDAAQIGIPEMRRPYKILQEECANIQVPFLDITSVFEKQPDLKSLYLFPMDAHTNSRGNYIIAENLYDYIVTQILNLKVRKS